MKFIYDDTSAPFATGQESCVPPDGYFKMDSFNIVVFGGAGDYSRRMLMPSLFHLFHDGAFSGDFLIIGFGLPALTDDEYRSLVKDALLKFAPASLTEEKWTEFGKHLSYISSSFDDEGNFEMLLRRLETQCIANRQNRKEVLFYFAVPPPYYPVIVRNIRKYHLCREGIEPKIVIEKPFGSDRASAIALNGMLAEVFSENQIYRVDHYLGKETVQNITFFRFANSIFEPLWNRRYIDYVEITVAEQLGVEHRGAFYEKAGVVRDIIQNHMMQLIALVAMEPPVGFDADLIRDEKVKVFKTIRLTDEEYIGNFMVRGQYGPGTVNGTAVKGYREEYGVEPDSDTPTFFAGTFLIDNWRWSGVPFYVRTGKRLAERCTEIAVHFKQPPLSLFGKTCDILAPNTLRLRIQPREELSLGLSVKYPGIGNTPYNVEMVFNYADTFKIERHSSHERLILDCLRGDLALFARQDGIEAMWRIVDPIIAQWDATPPRFFPNYEAGSWGPPGSDDLMTRDGRSWSSM